MTTARDLINDAFRDCGILGIGQTLGAEDVNYGFRIMNRMLATWQRKRWLIWHLVDTEFLANGAQFYTVGDGGNYDISPRPDRIEAAYFVQVVQSPNLPVSYPLEILESYEDYAALSLKTLQSWPEYVFYDSAFPTAKLYCWPIPNSGQYRIHILTKAILNQFTNLSEEMNLPAEYESAIEYNLVQRLLAGYPRAQMDPIQAANLKALAVDSLNVLRKANTQIPRLSLPRNLIRTGRYNIFSDRSY